MSLYRELPFKVATSWQQLVSRPEVANWLERELQALVLQADVSLIHSVVTSAMESAPQVCHASAPCSPDKTAIRTEVFKRKNNQKQSNQNKKSGVEIQPQEFVNIELRAIEITAPQVCQAGSQRQQEPGLPSPVGR
jgi:hypothetical protein